MSASIWCLQVVRLSYCEPFHPLLSQNSSLHVNHLLVFSFHCGRLRIRGRKPFVVRFELECNPRPYQCVAASDNGEEHVFMNVLWARLCKPSTCPCVPAHQLTTTACLLTAPCLRVASNSELMFKETDLFPYKLFFTPIYCPYLHLYEVTALGVLCENTLFGWTFSCCGACPAGVRDIKTRQLHSMQYRPSGKDSPLSVRLWTEARWPAVMYCNMGLCCCGSQWPPLGRETRELPTPESWSNHLLQDLQVGVTHCGCVTL